MRNRILASLLSLSTLSTPAVAGTNDFFNDLSGQWAGSGKAYLAQLGDVSANCQMMVDGAIGTVSMAGQCGLLVFRQSLSLNLITNGDRVNGTYSGSKTGTALLTGVIYGDQLVLAVAWNGLVNGDRAAQMLLQRSAENKFELTVIDKVDGETRNTSRFSFHRK